MTESIERLRIGDWVLAMDPATGEIGQHRVVDHFQRTAYELRVLEFISSDAKRQRIERTDEHPFFVLSEGAFIPAAELQIGDQCPGPQGEIQTLVATRVEPRPEGVPVFNFEVQHAHTYYVQAEELLGAPVLVHNARRNNCGLERRGGKGGRGGGPEHAAVQRRIASKASGDVEQKVYLSNGRYRIVDNLDARGRYHQVGDMRSRGGKYRPSARERGAIEDLRKELGDGVDIFYHDKLGKLPTLINPDLQPNWVPAPPKHRMLP